MSTMFKRRDIRIKIITLTVCKTDTGTDTANLWGASVPSGGSHGRGEFMGVGQAANKEPKQRRRQIKEEEEKKKKN